VHKFIILIVTSFICLWWINFSLSHALRTALQIEAYITTARSVQRSIYAVAKFSESRVADKVPNGSTLSFCKFPNFRTKHCRTNQNKHPCQKTRLNPFDRKTTSDRQTQGHMERKCAKNYTPVINDTINLFFKLQSAFWEFQTVTVSECCLKKIASVYFLWKIY